MTKDRIDLLREGCWILDPVMTAHGFLFEAVQSGMGSGGPFARGAYTCSQRKLEIHLRSHLGLVTYHFREISIDHDSYMGAVLGSAGGNKYPGFSDDPLDGFRGLASDLKNFAQEFLRGDFEGFSRHAEKAASASKIRGIAKIS